MKRLLTFLLIVFPLSVAAEITVTGRVIDSEKRAIPEAEITLHPFLHPVARAQLLLEQNMFPVPTARAASDESGTFSIQAPQAGLWRLEVRAVGYLPVERDLLPLYADTDVEDAQLEKATPFRVTILSPERKPVPGAIVLASAGGDEKWRPSVRLATTDAAGTASLPRAESERLRVSVSAATLQPAERTDVRGASTVVQLTAGKPFTIQAAGADEKPVPGALVTFGKNRHPLGFTDKDGRLAFFGAEARTPISVIAADGRQANIPWKRPVEGASFLMTLNPRTVVRGSVIDLETRRPIEGAFVWNLAELWNATKTDSKGRFPVNGNLTTEAIVKAAARGYLQNSLPVNFTAESNRESVIVLRPAAAIEGSILNDRQEPVSGAVISIQEGSAFLGRVVFDLAGADPIKVRSNDEGRFHIEGLDPDPSYRITAEAEGFAPAKREIHGLEPRKTLSGIRLFLITGSSARGTIVDEDDRPIRDATVRVEAANTMEPAHRRMMNVKKIETISDKDGIFAFQHLPPGTYNLEVSAAGFATREVRGLEAPETDKPADWEKIVLKPGVDLTGFVVDIDKQPVQGAAVYVFKGGPPPMNPKPDAETEVDGRFRVPDQTPETRVNLRVSRDGFITKEVEEIQVPQPEPLQIVLDPASRISGTVIDSQERAVAKAGVSIEQQRIIGGRSFFRRSRSVQTEEDGFFAFDNLEPSSYTISAVASGYQETKLEGVAVAKGKNIENLQVKLEPGAVIEGYVFTREGSPAAEAMVGLVPLEGRMPTVTVSTDGNGFYRLESVTPGKVSVEANHSNYPRTVKDLNAKRGINTLDLHFSAGQRVSGTVSDDRGSPLSGVLVELGGGSILGNLRDTTNDAGAFEIKGVPDGDYEVLLEKPGFAAGGEERIQVSGVSVEGLWFQMKPGTSISGNVIGLDPEALSQVTVLAMSRGEHYESTVNGAGAFRFQGIRPDRWTLMAQTASGRTVSKDVVVEQEAVETHVDLEFGQGLVLTGKALQGDEPLGGIWIGATGKETRSGAQSHTASDGSFRLEGLEKGMYEISLLEPKRGIHHTELVEMNSDRDILIRLPSARVAGRVLVAGDRSPIAGVTVVLEKQGQQDRPFLSPNVTTGLEGIFEIPNVADGDWKLIARKTGFGSASLPVHVGGGQDVTGLELVMEATEGWSARLALADGRTPQSVVAAVLDSTGGMLTSGPYQTGENGTLRIPTVPPGNWRVVLSVPGSAAVTVQAVVPGPTSTVVLPAPSRLHIVVPDLKTSNTTATAIVTAPDGTPHIEARWFGIQTSWTLSGGEMLLEQLPPGSWNVTVTAADGHQWNASTTTTTQNQTELTLQ